MTVARLTVSLAAQEPARLPFYKGSVIRGGFGLAFRRVACPFPKRECSDCLLRQKCVWSYVFATPRPEGSTIMRKYETIPHPFVIEPPEEDKTSYAPGDEVVFTLVLIGKAIESVPYFIYAFEQMAEQGLGSGRAKFKVAAVRQDGTPFYDPLAGTIAGAAVTQSLSLAPTAETAVSATLIFSTPTHIVYQGRVARRPAFHVVFRSLLRRIGLLVYFHDQPVEIDYQGLIKQAEAVKTESITTGTTQWRRFSTRQNRAIRMDGIMGKATYIGDLKPFLPYLRAGEVLHVGKSTAFGMGKYQLEVE
jgi:hypothetical protein